MKNLICLKGNLSCYIVFRSVFCVICAIIKVTGNATLVNLVEYKGSSGRESC